MNPDVENQLSLYLNTLAISTDIKAGETFLDLENTSEKGFY